MKIKKILRPAVLAALAGRLFFPHPGEAKDVKIGFVESSKILTDYQATAAANNQFNEFVNMYRDSASALQQQIEKMKSEMESQKLLLSEEARLKKLDEIESYTRAYNLFLQTIFGTSGKIEQKNDELMAPLLKKINDAVSRIAQQEGFSLVLDLSEGIFYASSDLNVTDLVINELNREFGPALIPGSELKKTIGIFPLREENTEAINAELGQKCQGDLYQASGSYNQKFKIVSSGMINTEILKRNLGRNVDDAQALNMALTPLVCDYIVVGRVTKISSKIDYELKLLNVGTKEEVHQRSNSVSATEDLKLREALAGDLKALLEKIPAE